MKKVVIILLAIITFILCGFTGLNCYNYLKIKKENKEIKKYIEEINKNIDETNVNIENSTNEYNEIKESKSEQIEDYNKWQERVKETQDLLS